MNECDCEVCSKLAGIVIYDERTGNRAVFRFTVGPWLNLPDYYSIAPRNRPDMFYRESDERIRIWQHSSGDRKIYWVVGFTVEDFK